VTIRIFHVANAKPAVSLPSSVHSVPRLFKLTTEARRTPRRNTEDGSRRHVERVVDGLKPGNLQVILCALCASVVHSQPTTEAQRTPRKSVDSGRGHSGHSTHSGPRGCDRGAAFDLSADEHDVAAGSTADRWARSHPGFSPSDHRSHKWRHRRNCAISSPAARSSVASCPSTTTPQQSCTRR
jgi:hypothetical protein